MTELVTIGSDELVVTASAMGAELQSITDRAGGAWLWDGDPHWWTGRAPILFPTVGATADGARFAGGHFPLGKHGFARGSLFSMRDRAADRVTFRLEDGPHTRKLYPFAFQLDVTHTVDASTLAILATVRNTGEEAMPVGFGFHPALRWPVPGATTKAGHIIRFDDDEPGPLRVIAPDGLIAPGERATPVEGNILPLRDDLFTHDALVWDSHSSRGLVYGVPGRPGVRVDFPDMPMLGLWTKPGAGYLCIEPWHSRADDESFTGAFADKPGVVTLPPGASHDFAMRLTFGVIV